MEANEDAAAAAAPAAAGEEEGKKKDGGEEAGQLGESAAASAGARGRRRRQEEGPLCSRCSCSCCCCCCCWCPHRRRRRRGEPRREGEEQVPCPSSSRLPRQIPLPRGARAAARADVVTAADAANVTRREPLGFDRRHARYYVLDAGGEGLRDPGGEGCCSSPLRPKAESSVSAECTPMAAASGTATLTAATTPPSPRRQCAPSSMPRLSTPSARRSTSAAGARRIWPTSSGRGAPSRERSRPACPRRRWARR